MHGPVRLASIALAVLVAAGAAHGQQFVDISPFQFNLSTPGARSLGMGGAFLALADDATAAYTNPAGLTHLTVGGPEVAVEARQWRFSNIFLDGGRFCASEPCATTSIGIDSAASGVELGEAENGVTGLSFLSVGYVLRGGFTLAVYRHELANFRSEYQSQGLLFGELALDCSPFGSCDLTCASGRCLRLPAVHSSIDLEIVDYGISGAYEFRKRKKNPISVGLGLAYYQLNLDSREELFGFRELGELPTNCDIGQYITFLDVPDVLPDLLRAPGHLLGPADFLADLHFCSAPVTLEGDVVGVNAGWLWKLGAAQRWSLGGVYRQGPLFETPLEDGSSLTYRVPDVYGLGVAFSSASRKTKVALDVNRVRYSQRFDDFRFIIANGAAAFFPDAPADTFRIRDVNELHLGFEHVFLVVESLFVGTVRLGVWHDPLHELEVARKDVVPPFVSELIRRRGDDVTHFSAGLGLVIKEDYQVDLAADFSDAGDTISISLVKFF